MFQDLLMLSISVIYGKARVFSSKKKKCFPVDQIACAEFKKDVVSQWLLTSGLITFCGDRSCSVNWVLTNEKPFFFFLGLVGITNLSAIDSEPAFSSSGWKCCLYRGFGWPCRHLKNQKRNLFWISSPPWCIRSNTFWCERYFCDKYVIEEASEKWNFPSLHAVSRFK